MTFDQAAELLSWMPKLYLVARLCFLMLCILFGGQLLQSYRLGRME